MSAEVTKIALLGAKLSMNLGGPSLLVATKKALDAAFPNAEYTLFVPPHSYEADLKLSPKYGVNVVPLHLRRSTVASILCKRCFAFLPGSKGNNGTVNTLEDSDVIIDILGILFTDSLGANSFRSRMREGIGFVAGKLLGKPVIKYTADLGPFQHTWNRFFAKLYLGHFVDLILVRSDTSRQYVKELGIKTPVQTVPDTAFLLPYCASAEAARYATLRGQSGLVGVSVSYQVRNRAPEAGAYVDTIVELANHCIEKYGAHVVLIPNELWQSANDDRRIAREICARVAHDRCDVLHTDTLTAQEIKGVINQCDIMVASRYHSIVAALSLAVPTLAIGWHHKYQEVLRLFEQEHRVCDIENLTLQAVVAGFEDLWENREQVSEKIAQHLPGVREQVLAGAKELQQYVPAKPPKRPDVWGTPAKN
jgi:polysaccharide pyruvyl transferase WcaK-like protein